MKTIFLSLLIAAGMALASEPPALKVGDQVPTFTLKNYDGTVYGLDKVLKENKYTVLIWVSTQCPVSNGYNERMEQLHETYGAKGVRIIGINSNKAEDVAAIADHAKEHGFKFPVLKDEKNVVADLYSAQVTPETFVIDSTGKLRYHGRIDDSRNPSKVQTHDITDALDALLAGKSVTRNETKAFGCSIKRVEAD